MTHILTQIHRLDDLYVVTPDIIATKMKQLKLKKRQYPIAIIELYCTQMRHDGSQMITEINGRSLALIAV